LQELKVPLYTDKNGRESFWKLDPDYRNRLSIPFTLRAGLRNDREPQGAEIRIEGESGYFIE
jgi:hypothetical protein